MATWTGWCCCSRTHDTTGLLLRSSGDGFLPDFPVARAPAMERLEAGVDPGGNAIILL